eukprot:464648_1
MAGAPDLGVRDIHYKRGQYEANSYMYEDDRNGKSALVMFKVPTTKDFNLRVHYHVLQDGTIDKVNYYSNRGVDSAANRQSKRSRVTLSNNAKANFESLATLIGKNYINNYVKPEATRVWDDDARNAEILEPREIPGSTPMQLIASGSQSKPRRRKNPLSQSSQSSQSAQSAPLIPVSTEPSQPTRSALKRERLAREKAEEAEEQLRLAQQLEEEKQRKKLAKLKRLELQKLEEARGKKKRCCFGICPCVIMANKEYDNFYSFEGEAIYNGYDHYDHNDIYDYLNAGADIGVIGSNDYNQHGKYSSSYSNINMIILLGVLFLICSVISFVTSCLCGAGFGYVLRDKFVKKPEDVD